MMLLVRLFRECFVDGEALFAFLTTWPQIVKELSRDQSHAIMAYQAGHYVENHGLQDEVLTSLAEHAPALVGRLRTKDGSARVDHGRVLPTPAPPCGPLVGREEALAWLAGRLDPRERSHKPVWIHLFGPPGVGKSAMAWHTVRDRIKQYDAFVWLSLNNGGLGPAMSQLDPMFIEHGLAVGQVDRFGALRGLLEDGGRHLLVLDGLGDGGLLHLIEPRIGRVDILITSNRSLAYPAERCRVGALSDDAALHVLFGRQHDLQDEAARRICALLDGHPLALQAARSHWHLDKGFTTASEVLEDIGGRCLLKLLNLRDLYLPSLGELWRGYHRPELEWAFNLLLVCCVLEPEPHPLGLLERLARAVLTEHTSLFRSARSELALGTRRAGLGWLLDRHLLIPGDDTSPRTLKIPRLVQRHLLVEVDPYTIDGVWRVVREAAADLKMVERLPGC